MNRHLLFNISAKGLPALLAIFTLAAHAQPRYTLTDLGPAGNPFSQATWVSDTGLVTGFITTSTGAAHAVIWNHGQFTDIAKVGLGGPNSGAGGANLFGEIMGGAETAKKDPNNENFCGYFSGFQCLSFLYERGVMTALPTLGGTNASWGSINNLGQISGYAETNRRDPTCPTTPYSNGVGPLSFDYEAVIWGPRPNQIRELSPLHGDTVGAALGINDLGQAAGVSGNCNNLIPPPFTAGPHSVMWDSDGSVHDLGNLGGIGNPALGTGNFACVINNRGQVIGASTLSDNATFHPYLWSRQTGMVDLNVLPGDNVGAALGLNNFGDVVGASIAGSGPLTGNPRAFVWHKGHMSDLNTLIPANSSMYLLTAFAINDLGQIAGFGAVISGPDAGTVHGFLATPKY